MKQTSLDNLQAAFAGESQAHMKYSAFAERAEREGLTEVARLFRAAAYAERIHATGHLRTMGGIGKTVENLAGAIAGETYEIEEMYPSFRAVAELDQETAAFRSHTWAWEAEKVHAELYQRARQAVEGGQDVQLGQVYVCSVCGWTGEGEPPDDCPLCKAKKDKFVVF